MAMTTFSVRGLALLLVFALLPMGALAPDVPAVGDAFAGFGEELVARLETTPLDAIVRLGNLLLGTGTLDISAAAEEGGFTTSVQWDTPQNAAQIDFNMEMGELPIGATAVINDVRAAVSVPMLTGESYLGITYETALDELIEMGIIDQDMMDMLPAYLDYLSTLDIETLEASEAALVAIVSDFFAANAPEVVTEDGITSITYTIDNTQFAALLDELLEAVAEDEALREYFEMIAASMVAPYGAAEPFMLAEEYEGLLTDEALLDYDGVIALDEEGNYSIYEQPENVELAEGIMPLEVAIIGGADGPTAISISATENISSFDSLVESMKELIGYVAESEFTATLAMSLDSNDRLCGLEIGAVAGEFSYGVALDLGESALDDWTITALEDGAVVAQIVWTIEDTHNEIIISANDETVATLCSEWDLESTVYTLRYDDEAVLTGTYVQNEDGGFHLGFDDIGGVFLTIDATAAAEISDPEYLELSEWLPDMLPLLESILGFGMSGDTVLAPEPVFVAPTNAVVSIDGEISEIRGYELMDQNYFRLRDLAMALDGTEKQFAVIWDAEREVVILDFGTEYTPSGVEFAALPEGERGDFKWSGVMLEYAMPDAADGFVIHGEWIDGVEIDGNNFIRISDFASLLDFGIAWSDSEYTIYIDTTAVYEGVEILD